MENRALFDDRPRGNVLWMGAEDRLRHHGAMPLKDDPHPVLGSQRINLTFRKAG